MSILTRLIATVAMLMVGSANMGCVFYICDEPQAINEIID